MDIEEMDVADAYRIRPRLFTDDRGSFFESFKADELARATGHRFTPVQVNYSASRVNTVRGLHAVSLPPGQAKYVSCVRGRLLDVVVDVRTGSPTFGRHDVTVLDAREGTAVYLAEGLAHGFAALTDDACISYLCSTPYAPAAQLAVRALDPGLGLPWDRALTAAPVLSPRDAAAPTLAEAAAAGLLPSYADCLARRARPAVQRQSSGAAQSRSVHAGDGLLRRPEREAR